MNTFDDKENRPQEGVTPPPENQIQGEGFVFSDPKFPRQNFGEAPTEAPSEPPRQNFGEAPTEAPSEPPRHNFGETPTETPRGAYEDEEPWSPPPRRTPTPQGNQPGQTNQSGQPVQPGQAGWGWSTPPQQNRPTHNPYPNHGNNGGSWNQGPNYNYNGSSCGNGVGGGTGGLGGGYGNQEAYKWNFEDYERAAQNGRPPQRKKSRGLMVFASLLCAVAVLGVALFAGYSVYNSMGGHTADPGVSSSLPTSSGGGSFGISVQDKPENSTTDAPTGVLSTAQVAKKVGPSVVGIANYQGNSSFTASGEGSGIIMTEDGYIVTNAHVVEGAKGITVVLSNGETYAGTLIGMDSKTDLAVIKIDARNLTYAEFGNSDQVEVGEDVIAIGNPSGISLAGSVTKGIVSAVNRVVDGSSYSIPYIQTDAAINPGNSGGALVNAYGQVIGINSAKLVATDYEGIGFAIPINSAMPIIQELISYGRVTGRAELGMTGQMVDETLARFNGTPSGVGVVSVKPDSDLARKNVAAGDIITKIDDTPVTAFKVITDVVATKKPGDTVKLTIYRKGVGGAGKSFDVNVTLVEENGN